MRVLTVIQAISFIFLLSFFGFSNGLCENKGSIPNALQKPSWIKKINDTYRSIIIANQNIYSAGNLSVGKFNLNGEAIWERKNFTTNYTESDKMGLVIDGKFIYAIKYEMFAGNGSRIVSLLKYDDTGTLLWGKIVDINNSKPYLHHMIWLDSIALLNSDIYVAGTCVDCRDNDTMPSYIIIKYDSKGQMAWNRTYGILNTEEKHTGEKLVVLNGRIYIVGSAVNYTPPTYCYTFIYIFNNDASFFMEKKHPTPDCMALKDITVDNSYIYGVGTENTQGYVIKFDSDGDIVFNASYGIIDKNINTIALSISISNNYLYVSGYVYNSMLGSSGMIAKFNKDGKVIYLNSSWDKNKAIPFVTGIAYYRGIYALGNSSITRLIDVPTTPDNFSLAFGNRTAMLSWEKPIDLSEGVSKYYIYRGKINETMSAVASTTNFSYLDTSLKNGLTYRYYVVAEDVNGDMGLPSETLSGIPLAIPWPPINVTAIGTNDGILVSWDPPQDDGGSRITQYKLYRAETSSKMVPIALIAGQQYIDQNISRNTIYYYRVSAINFMGEGNVSSLVSAKSVGPITNEWIALFFLFIAIIILGFLLFYLIKKRKKVKSVSHESK